MCSQFEIKTCDAFEIGRFIGPAHGFHGESAILFHLYVFDASQRAYWAFVYLSTCVPCSKNSICISFFVMARARVAHFKAVTLPRLELLGSLMAVRLLFFVKEALLSIQLLD